MSEITITILDALIIVGLGLFLYRLIRNTDAIKVFIGLLVLTVVYYVANVVGLKNTAAVFKNMFELISVGLLVIFHQELRMVLRKIGGFTNIKPKEKMDLVNEIEEAVFSLSEQRIGALIIFDPDGKLMFQTESMVKIDANCTKEVIEAIFFPNSPLHDGAMIIQNGKIAYAGCKLPFSGRKRDELGYAGTRHHVAVETAENLDITAIVVSEETGKISIATRKDIFKVKNSLMFRAFFKTKPKTKNWYQKLFAKK